MRIHGGHVLGAAPGRLDLYPPRAIAARPTPQESMLLPQRIQAMSGLTGIWVPQPANCYSDSAGTTAAVKDGVVGLLLDMGPRAINGVQATTSLKPTLRQTPITGVWWLDPPASGALTVTLPSAVTSATRYTVTPTGVAKQTGVNLGSSFNLVAPYTYFGGAIYIDEAVHGAVTPLEEAAILRFLSQFVPALSNQLVGNPSFDVSLSGWSPATSTWSWDNGAAVSNGVGTQTLNRSNNYNWVLGTQFYAEVAGSISQGAFGAMYLGNANIPCGGITAAQMATGVRRVSVNAEASSRLVGLSLNGSTIVRIEAILAYIIL